MLLQVLDPWDFLAGDLACQLGMIRDFISCPGCRAEFRPPPPAECGTSIISPITLKAVGREGWKSVVQLRRTVYLVPEELFWVRSRKYSRGQIG